MKKHLLFLFSLLCVVVLAQPLFSQEKETPLKKGAWALQFQLSGSLLDFTVRDYLGTTFSGKYHLSERRAIRFGINISGSSLDSQNNNEGFYGPDEHRVANSDVTSSDHSIQFVEHHLWYPRQTDGIYLFAGFGPTFGLTVRKYNLLEELIDEDEAPQNLAETHYKLEQIYFLGLSGVLGIEYFLFKNVGITAEFQSMLGYNYGSIKTEHTINSALNSDSNRIYTETQTSRGFNYRSNSVKIGASIYF